ERPADEQAGARNRDDEKQPCDRQRDPRGGDGCAALLRCFVDCGHSTSPCAGLHLSFLHEIGRHHRAGLLVSRYRIARFPRLPRILLDRSADWSRCATKRASRSRSAYARPTSVGSTKLGKASQAGTNHLTRTPVVGTVRCKEPRNSEETAASAPDSIAVFLRL